MAETNKYNAKADLDSLRENAQDFADAQFRVMRLHGIESDGSCGCGWEDCKNAGKHPSTKNWSKLPHTDADSIENWFEVGAVQHGMGVVLDDDILIVDVDAKGSKVGAESQLELEKALGDTLANLSTFIVDSGSGNGSRHYWFKKPRDVSIKKTLKQYPDIDFLSRGCYVVMPGSVHKSGGVYSYPAIKKSDPSKIIAAPDALVSVVKREFHFSEQHAEPGSCDIAELREALMSIPNDGPKSYDEKWLPIGMALHHEMSGDNHGYQMWVDWSEQNPDHDESQMPYKWESFGSGYGGTKCTGGTIFALAMENGWERDYSKLVDLNPFLDRMTTGEVQQLEIVKNDTVFKNDGLPDSLKCAPGMIGIIADYIMSQAPKPLYLPSIAAAIAYCSVTAARDYRSDQDNYSSLYMINIAPTGAGKEKPRSVIKDIMVATGQSKSVRNEPTSSGAIATTLLEAPRALLTIDEIGHSIQSGNGRNASQNKVEVRSSLMELFGLCGSTYLPQTYSRMSEYKHGTENTDEVDLTIQKPAISVLGMTTPGKLIDSIDRMMIQDGFINRFIIVQAHEGRQMRQEIERRPIPQSILNWSETVLNRRASAGNLATFTKDTYNVRQDEVVLSFTNEAKEVLTAFEREIMAHMNKMEKRGLDELYSRCVEQAMRLALIVELACRPQSIKIERESVQFAIDFVYYNVQQFEKLVSFELVESKQEGFYRDALKAIKSYAEKGVSRTDLYRVSPFKGMKTNDKKELLQHLIDTDQIVCETIKTGGAPKNVFYAREYVRNASGE